MVDEFLRDELNYVVVKSWDAARGRRARAEVGRRRPSHIPDSSKLRRRASFQRTIDADTIAAAGVTPLKDAVRVLNGFGRSLEAILPKLRDGYLRGDSGDWHRRWRRACACVIS